MNKQNEISKMEILKIDTNVLLNAPIQYKEFIEAKSFGQIKAFSQKEIELFCLDIVTSGLHFLGLKDSCSDEILNFQTNALLKEINLNFNNLTKAEIILAFKYGLRNKFGQVFGMNQKTYFQFMDGYVKMSERAEAIKYLNASLEEKPVEKSLAEKELIMKNAALKYFAEYKASGIFQRNYYIVHDYVNKMKGRKIIVNGKEKQTLIENELIRIKIKEESYAEYVHYIESTATEYKLHGNITRAKQTLSLLDNLDSNISYVILQKKNALKHYFDSINELEL